MKSGLLAHVNMGNMSLWLCRGRQGEYFRQWKAVSLPAEAKVTVLSVQGVFYNLYLTIPAGQYF